MGYIAIKLPYVVHKNGAHRLPIVPHLLATQLDQHAVRSLEYACALGICEEVYVHHYAMDQGDIHPIIFTRHGDLFP